MFPTKSESAIHRLAMLLLDKVPERIGAGGAGGTGILPVYSVRDAPGLYPFVGALPTPLCFCKCGF
jgi:hypothetical protein